MFASTLPDEVGADVGALGEDAAAETGEDRDQRAAEGEADQRVGVRRAAASIAIRPIGEQQAERRPP